MLVLGGKNQHTFSDITAAGDGTLIAIISSPFQGINAKDVPGIYKSTNDGTDWINITPNSFPLDHMRSVLGLAPSNPSILYILTHAGDLQNGREDIRFFKLNLSDGTSEDRSNNLPDFSQALPIRQKQRVEMFSTACSIWELQPLYRC